MNRKRRLLWVGSVVAIVAASVAAFLWHLQATFVAMPEFDEISDVRMIHNPAVAADNEPTKAEFKVPRKHWKPILNSLKPYRRKVAVWSTGMCPGIIYIETKNGDIFEIVLLVHEHDKITCRLGPDGVLHIGGSKKRMNDAIWAARRASLK